MQVKVEVAYANASCDTYRNDPETNRGLENRYVAEWRYEKKENQTLRSSLEVGIDNQESL